MRLVAEYRDPQRVRRLTDALAHAATKPWTLMEVCGGQTHSIVKHGLDELLPEPIELVHGPGCPVCVTPIELIDAACELAARPDVVLTSFGDMVRVPGSRTDLARTKAAGGDVRIVYSPLDAVALAQATPEREVVFFAVGFETTAPANAFAVLEAERRGVTNFSLIVSHVLVPPAMEAILVAPGNRVQGFLAAGHVCTIEGLEAYEALARAHRVPIVVTGFEPVDILDGVLRCVNQLERGEARVENAYARAVRSDGNRLAREAVARVFQRTARRWRGLAELPESGLRLRPELAHRDALERLGCRPPEARPPAECRSGEVLTGILRPSECPAFGTRCTPEHPLGAPMVSTEGACAAYYRYRPDVTTSTP